MSEYVVRPLTTDTWDAFAQMVERHNGGPGTRRARLRRRRQLSAVVLEGALDLIAAAGGSRCSTTARGRLLMRWTVDPG